MPVKSEINPKTFTKNLKVLMVYKNVNTKTLCAEIKIDDKSAYNYQQGKIVPPLSILSRMAEYFNVTIDELIFKKVTLKFK